MLRVLDHMLPASRSLKDLTLAEVLNFAFRMDQFEVHAYPMNPAFMAALRSKWTTAAMVAMRKARGLDSAERVEDTRMMWLMLPTVTTLPSSASWSALCRHAASGRCLCSSSSFVPRVAPCGTAPRSTGRCTGGSTSPRAAQLQPHSRLRIRLTSNQWKSTNLHTKCPKTPLLGGADFDFCS